MCLYLWWALSVGLILLSTQLLYLGINLILHILEWKCLIKNVLKNVFLIYLKLNNPALKESQESNLKLKQCGHIIYFQQKLYGYLVSLLVSKRFREQYS